MRLDFTDDEIIEALEINYGLITKAARYLNEQGKDFDRHISSNMITARLERSTDLRLRYEDIRKLIVDEAEWTVIAKMMGDQEAVRRNMLAAEMILTNLGNWNKKQEGDSDLPGVIVNLGPTFTTNEEWSDAYKKLPRRNGIQQEMSDEDKKMFTTFDRV
jgi:hypothetical protein